MEYNELENYKDDQVIGMANSSTDKKFYEALAKRMAANSLEDEVYSYKEEKEEIPKIDLKSIISKFLIVATVIAMLSVVVYGVSDKVTRANKLNDANKYMNTKMVSYLEKSDVSYSLTDGSKITILETDKDKLSNLCKMMEQDGFTRDELVYVIYEICGEDSVDKVIVTYGYDDASSFLFRNYKNPDTYQPDVKCLENNVEVGYISKVENIILGEEKKIAVSKEVKK